LFSTFFAAILTMHRLVKYIVAYTLGPVHVLRVLRWSLLCRSSHTGKMLRAKLYARALAFLALMWAGGCLKTAAALYDQKCNPLLPPESRIKAPKAFIAYQKKKLLETGGLQDRKRSGRKTKISKDTIAHCCEVLKGGYAVFEPALNTIGHRYWASIKDAVYGPNSNPFLAWVCTQHGVTPELLQKRLHRHDPNLAHKHLRFKKSLSPEQVFERQWVASRLLQLSLAQPTLLDSALWVDECAINFSGNDLKTVKVYCDRRSAAAQATHAMYRNIPGTRYRTITVRIIAAVNARIGPIYFEFTTGTTDINRWVLPNIIYKVSVHCCHPGYMSACGSSDHPQATAEHV
jgi:hypothetical protein